LIIDIFPFFCSIKICEFWFAEAFCYVFCIPYYGLVILEFCFIIFIGSFNLNTSIFPHLAIDLHILEYK
jgi:hypothetical protein